MIKAKEDKLIIKVPHPVPDEFASDLKTAIIFAIQTMELAEHTNPKELKETNITLLELLKNII